MSLLFYDFNNANQRLILKKQKQNGHPTNLADVIIPEAEEADDAPGANNNNGTVFSGDFGQEKQRGRGESIEERSDDDDDFDNKEDSRSPVMTLQDEQLLSR